MYSVITVKRVKLSGSNSWKTNRSQLHGTKYFKGRHQNLRLKCRLSWNKRYKLSKRISCHKNSDYKIEIIEKKMIGFST